MPIDADAAVRAALKSQYHAALAMLRQAIELCPDAVWAAKDHRNAPWQIAYHTLFFAHLYSEIDEHAFRPWIHHVADVQVPDGIPGPPDPESPLPLIADPYPKAQVLEYCDFCAARIDGAVDAMDVFAPESGFSWYPIPKLEHQILNVRHIQHGAAQLADRVRAAADEGVDWVGARRAG
jgi:hypothetical protein